MNRREWRRWRIRLCFLVFVPSLLAAILFFCAREADVGKGDSRDGSSAAAEAGAAEGSDGFYGGRESGAGGSGKNKGSASGEEGGSSTDSSLFPSYPDEESFLAAVFGKKSTGSADVEAVQGIAFTAGGGDARQRSFPVQIDASILGGESGTKCWAVFLPAEISLHPHIVFRDYESVTFEEVRAEKVQGKALGCYDSLEGSVGVPNAGVLMQGLLSAAESGGRAEDQSPEDSSGGKKRILSFSSGEEAAGLRNGGAYLVTMRPADTKKGEIGQELLYVFSCDGTASMYLDSKSGSMEKVDGDVTKQTSEDAFFSVYREDGSGDSAGSCRISGRGNSTWKMNKKPYNLNLTEKQSILGMEECKKLCLLSNSFDYTNLLNRVSSKLADTLSMRDTPDGEFVNLFLNGQYNGLYYLSQRVRTGGSVHIDKMDDRIQEANRGFAASPADAAQADVAAADREKDASADSEGTAAKKGSAAAQREDSENTPKRIPLFKEGERLKKYAYAWPAEPADNSGGYLLQQHEKYVGGDCWFSTNHRRFRIMSPSMPTVGEVEYLQDYMLSAERAIYSEDGVDPVTGKSFEEYLDMDSWEDMFILEEYFVEWDAERWSFFVTKDRGDPLLYCGPMWDFDHSAGLMIYGNYPETAVSTLVFRDSRHGWMHTLLSHESFCEAIGERWKTRFSPLIHSFLEEGDSSTLSMEKEISAIESAACMNNIRRANDRDFREDAEGLRTWLKRRAAFLDEYIAAQEKERSAASASGSSGKDDSAVSSKTAGENGSSAGSKTAGEGGLSAGSKSTGEGGLSAESKSTGEDGSSADSQSAGAEASAAAGGESLYCRVEFSFPWGILSHYVRRGETLGYLPTPEYGETQVPSQVAKYEIIGWKDEKGAAIDASVVIDADRVFEPIYRQ